MRVLCVAEKPSIAKSISQILSGGQFTTHSTQNKFIKNYEFTYPRTNSFYTVTCVSGHLMEYDFYDTHRKWNSCDPIALFDAAVETSVAKDKRTIESNLLAQARNAETLMIWTDCDREGEHIGLEIVKICRRAKRNITVKRARFSAIIAEQIHRAAQHPVELDLAQADAVEARILLDLKVGAAFTRLQTLTLQAQLGQLADQKSVVSYGPCQFPTLGFVVQQYNKVKAFVPEPFWYIYLSLSRPTSEETRETVFNWRRGHLFDELAAINIYSYVLSSPTARVTKLTSKATKKWKPLPLTTVELQKAGSRLLRLTPKKVLDIAEKLYQQGFVSYPRTETDQFDEQFDLMALVDKQIVDPAWGAFAVSLQQGGFSVPRKGKNNDKAHPPIHPTAHAGNLAGDEKKVYEFITRRYLACCSKDAEGWQTTVDIVCGMEEFYVSGLIVLNRHYLDVYPYDKWQSNNLPTFHEGEEFQPSVCELKEGRTTRPNFLTEADLVNLMDKNGIGTDATIAQHIQTIVDREYVIERMEGAIKYLVPSTLGVGLIEGYNQIGLNKSVSKPQLRRETERRMVQICEGGSTKNDMLAQSIEQYKEMFRITCREFDKVVASVRQHLNNNGDAEGGRNADGGGGGGGGGRGGGGGNGRGGGGGRGRGSGRDEGDQVGRNSNRGRGRGRRGSGGERGRPGLRSGDPPFNSANGSSRAHATDLTPEDNDRDVEIISVPRITSTHKIQKSAVSTHSANASSSRLGGSSTAVVASGSKPVSSGARGSVVIGRGDDAEVKCNCNMAAARRTVVKAASKGRQFWACGSGTSCGFFKWIDDVSMADATDGTSVPAKRQYPTGLESSEARMCSFCKIPARSNVTHKEGPNQGRKFWKCPRESEINCDFFEWDDEPPRHSNQFRGTAPTPRTGACLECNQEGHWARSCPNKEANRHKRPRSISFNTNTSGPFTSTSDVCFHCQQPGHYINKCPNKARDFRANVQQGSGECFNCGATGHWAKDCSMSGSLSRSAIPATRRGRGQGPTRANRGTTKRSGFRAADGF